MLIILSTLYATFIIATLLSTLLLSTTNTVNYSDSNDFVTIVNSKGDSITLEAIYPPKEITKEITNKEEVLVDNISTLEINLAYDIDVSEFYVDSQLEISSFLSEVFNFTPAFNINNTLDSIFAI